MLRPDTLALTALLALLTAVGPMSVDLYLPSLPELGRVFGASVPQVQLTLSGYLLCFAIGQIVFGPISDHVGRKPVLLAALSLYVAVCLSCMFATSIEMLIALRCLQALGVAGAPVLARAIVRDLYHGVRAGRELARMGSITALAPVVAPSLGGVLQSTFGWRASFLGMAALGLCAIVLVIRLLPETMKQPPKQPMSLSVHHQGLRHLPPPSHLPHLSGDRATSYGGLFAWISGSSFVLQDLYGLSPLIFGLVFAAATLGYGLGTLLAARLVMRIGIDRTIVCGGVALAAGGLAMAAVHRIGRDFARGAGLADGALSLRSRPRHAAIDGGCAHAVSRARRRRLIAARLPAAGDRVRDRHRGGANARIERAAAGRDHRHHGRTRTRARAVQAVDGSRSLKRDDFSRSIILLPLSVCA